MHKSNTKLSKLGLVREYAGGVKHRVFIFISVLVITISTLGIGIARANMPVAAPSVTELSLTSPDARRVSLDLPKGMQSSVGILGYDGFIDSPNQKSLPIASTAKLITALTVLDRKPLRPGEQGPTITMSSADEALYHQYLAKNGSNARVVAGTKLTEYQMLQGVLLPSSNNYADSLAIWAFGSLENYRIAANKFVKAAGMKQTTVGTDASGFNPDTTSTASDLAKLARLAMNNQVIREIVAQSSAQLPTAGVVQSTNKLLGQDGFAGIKTGNTVEAGGVYIFANQYKLQSNNQEVTIIGVVQGAADVPTAMIESRGLVEQVRQQLTQVRLIKKGQVVGRISTEWGDKSLVLASSDVVSLNWGAGSVAPKLSFELPAVPIAGGAAVGKISVGDGSSDLVTDSAIGDSSLKWRIFQR